MTDLDAFICRSTYFIDHCQTSVGEHDTSRRKVYNQDMNGKSRLAIISDAIITDVLGMTT